jgi:hypothetical protein
MASKERHLEEKIISHVFRKPSLSNISDSENGETGREFLAIGQKSTQMIEMGGSCYTKIEYYGRVGVIGADDAKQSYIYVDADGRPEPLTVEEEMPYIDALAILQDAEACKRFVTDCLVSVLDLEAQEL